MLIGGYATQDKDAGPNGGTYPEDNEVGDAQYLLQAVLGGLALAQEFRDGLLSEESRRQGLSSVFPCRGVL